MLGICALILECSPVIDNGQSTLSVSETETAYLLFIFFRKTERNINVEPKRFVRIVLIERFSTEIKVRTYYLLTYYDLIAIQL